MTPERFGALAEAYGGDISRWPPAERDAARAWATRHAEAADAALAAASALDALLDAGPAPRPSAALAERIVAGAPRARFRPRTTWWLPAGMGAGLAAACAAGVVVGQQLAQPPSANPADAVVVAVSEGLGLYADDGA